MTLVFGGHTILIGTDFSSNAAVAAEAAAGLAKRLFEGVTLIHVARKPAGTDPQVLRKRLAPLRERLHREAERLKGFGVVVEEKLLLGKPEEELGREGERSGVRCLFISSRGKSAAQRWFLGSTAEKIVEHSKVPAFVIHSSAALRDWAQGRQALRIFVGVHGSFSSEAALRWAGALGEVAPSEITVGFIAHPERETKRFGLDDSSLRDATRSSDLKELLERDLKKQVSLALKGKSSRVRVESGKRWTCLELLRLAREEKADLLVIGGHGKRGPCSSSVPQSLLRNLPMNVVCVPESKAAETQHASVPEVKSVLVPTDFSLVGNRAIPFAMSVLSRGGTVYLVHVLDSKNRTERSDTRRFESSRRRAEQKSQANFFAARLGDLVPVGAEARGISTQTEVFLGNDAAKTICQAAERLGVDLICLGSHGHGSLMQLIGGSVAKGVLAQSRKPVLVVPPAA